MPQDAVTLKHVAKELSDALTGGKINKITQPVRDEVDLLVYAEGKTRRVVFSANASACRVGFSDLERENPLVCYAFCMLLRKHLSGGTIEKVERVGSDRVVAVTVKNRNDLREESNKILYAEIMGKYSNLILTEGGKILGAIKTASLDESRKRAVMPNFPYAPPPAQDKADFADKEGAIALFSSCTAVDPDAVGEYLFTRFKGFSFPTAKEIAAQLSAADLSMKNDPEKAYDFISAFCNEKPLSPCVLTVKGKPTDFFLFPYQTLEGEYAFYPSLLAAQNAFYTQKEGRAILEEGKKRFLSAVKSQETKLRRRLAVIEAKERDCADMETLRKKGEILLSNLWQIPAGAKTIRLPDYYAEEENAAVEIALDPTLSAQENAQKLFKRYDKAKKTLAAVAPQKRDALEELRYVESVLGEISRLESPAEFAEIEAELTNEGYLKKSGNKKQKTQVKSQPLRYEIDGFSVLVGKNNLQNDLLTQSAKGGDLWLHAKDFHSSHVIVETGGKTPPDAVIGRAAELCAHYSSARGSGKIPVDYTLKKYVKKPSGAKPGFVVYTNQQTTFVSSDPHEECRVRR